MKLFAIRQQTSHALVSNVFFESKEKAKKERDRLNQENPNNKYVVTPGPDHYKFKKQ